MSSSDRWWSLIIGSGIALSSIHNQFLTTLLTNASGETLFFLPAFAYLLLIMGTGLFIVNNWERVRQSGLGDKRLWIPLSVIVLAIGLSGITADSLMDRIAPLGMGLSLFALYLVSRILGRAVFRSLAIGAGIATLGVILHGFIFPGLVTGGFVFERNYDVVVGYILLGTVLYAHKRLWLAVSLVLVAMFLTGSPEAVFAVGAIGAVVLLRRDIGKRLVIAVIPMVAIMALWFGLGFGQDLYSYVGGTIEGEPAVEVKSGVGLWGTTAMVVPEDEVDTTDAVKQAESGDEYVSALGYRLEVIKRSMANLEPLGEGYNLTDFGRSPNVHNVPLVIVQQLGWPGILAGLAWLWISVWCLVKTRWKYAWCLVLALSVWDHYIWTQLAPVWWVIVGVSTVSPSSAVDFIFRKTE